MSGKRVKAGEAYVLLGTKDMITKSLNRIGARFKRWGAGISKMGKIIAAAGLVAVAPIIGAITKFTSFGDTLDKMSDRIGFSVESLAELSFAANRSGTSITAVEKAAKRMQGSIYDLSEGLTTATDAYDKLGLSSDDLVGKSPEEQFELIAKRLADIEDLSLRSALAQRIFGKSGVDLLPMIANMDTLRKKARELGFTLSGDQATAAAKLNDAWGDLMTGFKAGSIQIGAALAPMLTKLFNRVVQVVSGVAKWIQQNPQLVQQVAKVIAVVLGVGTTLVTLGGIISTTGIGIIGMSAAFSAAISVLGAILSPVAAAAAAIIGLGVAFVNFSKVGGQAIGWLKTQLSSLLSFLGKVLGGMRDAFQAGNLQLAVRILWLGIKIAFNQGVKVVLNTWDSMVVGMMNAWMAMSAAIVRFFIFIAGKVADFVNLLLSGIDRALKAINSLFGTELRLRIRVDFDDRGLDKHYKDKEKGMREGRIKALGKKFAERDAQIAKLQKDLDEANAKAAEERRLADLQRANRLEELKVGKPNIGVPAFQTQQVANKITTQGAFGSAALGISGIGGTTEIQRGFDNLLEAQNKGNDIQQDILDEVRDQ